jgi:replicative superfamily II helicase
MLQSRLNEGLGPALYLCPNRYLVEQTCAQAQRFGIQTCIAEGELPQQFLDGTSILVATVKKLFNGLTKFGLGRHSQLVTSTPRSKTSARLFEFECRIQTLHTAIF